MQINRHHFISIDSTNTWAKLNAASFPKNQLTIVTAEAQTAGRGRFNRQWISPPKENIYATFCFFEKNLNPNVGNIPQVMAISIAKTLELFGFKPSLKWPNDILINNKKIGGILTETVAVDDLIAILIGVGINVNMPMETLAQIGRPATSLMSESNRIFQTEEILKRLEEQFNKDLQLFLETGFESTKSTFSFHQDTQSNSMTGQRF